MKINLTHAVEVKIEAGGLKIGETLVTYGLLLSDPEIVASLKARLCPECCHGGCSELVCSAAPTSN